MLIWQVVLNPLEFLKTFWNMIFTLKKRTPEKQKILFYQRVT